jgi:hypothetical protein
MRVILRARNLDGKGDEVVVAEPTALSGTRHVTLLIRKPLLPVHCALVSDRYTPHTGVPRS